MLDLTRRFSFGLNLDDPWRYSGIPPPKSIIIPHLLSVGLPESEVLDEVDDKEIMAHGEPEPHAAAGRAALALAETLVDAGVDFVRCWFPWKYFEPTPVPKEGLDRLLDRSYSLWPMDTLVDALTRKGVGIVPVLACGYQRMLPQGLEPHPDKQLYLKRVSIHARLLTRHYKDRIRSWQIENEPNWWAEHEAGGWRSGLAWIEDHGFRMELLKTLNDAVHTEDPSATSIINLEADSKTLNSGLYSSMCDILGLDFYPNYKLAYPVNPNVPKLVDHVRKEIQKPMLISETGYPSAPAVLGYSPARQAEYVEKATREAFMSQEVTGIGIWRYIDTAWRSFPPQENHFGLFDNKGSPKPVWTTYSRTIKELK